MSVTVLLLFRAVTEKRDRPALREMLQQAQRELLSVILDVPVPLVEPPSRNSFT
jgi:hypothetical protein